MPSHRLIIELKLPPADAYFKLRHTLDEVNALLRCVIFLSVCLDLINPLF